MDEPRCLLIVDDHDDIRRMMQFTLEREGYDVRTAAGGREGLAILRTGEPDLLILDLMMPVLSGWDILVIRAADPLLQRIPTIVTTANTSFDEIEAVRHGVFAVLHKPFDPSRLRTLVESGLSELAKRGQHGP